MQMVSAEKACIESSFDGLKPEIQIRVKPTYETFTDASTDPIIIDRKQTAINELQKTKSTNEITPRHEQVGTVVRNAVICQICKRAGHVADKCWFRNRTAAKSPDNHNSTSPRVSKPQKKTKTNSSEDKKNSKMENEKKLRKSCISFSSIRKVSNFIKTVEIV